MEQKITDRITEYLISLVDYREKKVKKWKFPGTADLYATLLFLLTEDEGEVPFLEAAKKFCTTLSEKEIGDIIQSRTWTIRVDTRRATEIQNKILRDAVPSKMILEFLEYCTKKGGLVGEHRLLKKSFEKEANKYKKFLRKRFKKLCKAFDRIPTTFGENEEASEELKANKDAFDLWRWQWKTGSASSP
ncbi:MAG: hypothetical protein FWH06_00410 [Oscillospiraceae bacterium]|nr:hypothetical protein [Oscillospiraceae bacterium]